MTKHFIYVDAASSETYRGCSGGPVISRETNSRAIVIGIYVGAEIHDSLWGTDVRHVVRRWPAQALKFAGD